MSSQTIHGSYTLVPMPDGTEVMMHRLSDGRWVTTEERVRQNETEAFMARFKDTDFAPAAHTPQTVGTLTPNRDNPLTRLDAYLGEIVGTPENVIARDPISMAKIAHLKSRPQELRHFLGMLGVLGPDPRWQKVKAIIIGEV